jgi:hypothetical protein
LYGEIVGDPEIDQSTRMKAYYPFRSKISVGIVAVISSGLEPKAQSFEEPLTKRLGRRQYETDKE